MGVHRFSLRAAALACCLAVGTVAAGTLPLPAHLISLGSDQGAQMLIDSGARNAYWPLSIQFVTQVNQAYCGVATLVMVLNALGVPAPATPGIEPFTTFTQDNVLNERTEQVLRKETLAKQGMTLDEFARMLGTYPVTAEVHHADQSSADQFRTLASRYLGGRDRHVVVNYLRRTLGQERGGHISALAAYDANTDRFLVLDVSRYKYPPVWVRTADLYSAMDTVDADNEGRKRGFVLVSQEPPNDRARYREPAPMQRPWRPAELQGTRRDPASACAPRRPWRHGSFVATGIVCTTR